MGRRVAEGCLYLYTSPEVLQPPHVKRMGVYARFYDYLRQQRSNRNGTVAGGRHLTDAEIARDMGVAPRWVRRARKRMLEGGYIEVREIRQGGVYVITVGLAYRIVWPNSQMRLLSPGKLVEMGKQKPVRNNRGVRPKAAGISAESGRVIPSLRTEKNHREIHSAPDTGACEYLSNREEKAERLRREAADLADTYAGANDVPEAVRLRMADIVIELEETESEITEAKTYLAAEARRETAEARRQAV